MSIGIIGCGISGVQLALRLQQAGIDIVLYNDRSPDEIRDGRLPNTVVRFGPTRARERALQVNHWDDGPGEMLAAELHFRAPTPFGFVAPVPDPGQFLDFRIYLSQLMEDVEDRGGTVELGHSLDPALVHEVAARHDLVVVASGRSTMSELFPRNDARSTYDAPARVLCAGLFDGIDPVEHQGLVFTIIPGVGEIFNGGFETFGGLSSTLLFEAMPGGPLEALAHARHDEDPAAFARLALALIEEHAPNLRDRIDPATFGVRRPEDLLQGSIVPTVRHLWTRVGDRFAVAIGDAGIVNDPIAGQGANLGSRSAFAIAELIEAGGPYDEDFCRRADQALWVLARPVNVFNDKLLAPPEPQVLELMITAATDQRVADAWVATFGEPHLAAGALESPAGTAAFIAAATSGNGDGSERSPRPNVVTGAST